MLKQGASSSLLGAFRGLSLAQRPTLATTLRSDLTSCLARPSPISASPIRLFSVTAARDGSWLEPDIDRTKKKMKGRARVATGGSTKGTTVIWGDYGLRMKDHHRRISAKQLKTAEDTIKARLRGQRYRLFKRVACNIGVYVSGNEIRMGKGKGSFDHWAARVAVSQIIFELRGEVHEAIVRDAFRLAGNKLPGQHEFVTKGEPPVVGITKLEGVTMEELKRPRRKLLTPEVNIATEALATPTVAAPPTA